MMGVRPDIHYEAKVSPELVALLRGGPGVAPPRRAIPDTVAAEAPPPPPVEAQPPAPPREDIRPAEPPADPGWPRHSLRCDGRRPLQFSGLPLWHDDADAGYVDGDGRTCQARRRFGLFLTSERRLVAHLAVVPQDGLPLRPIHRAAYMDAPGDLERFLIENDPSDCAAVAPWSGAAVDLEMLWDGLRLGPPLTPGPNTGTATT